MTLTTDERAALSERGRHRRSQSPWTRLLSRPWLVAGVLAFSVGLVIAVLTPPFTGGDERDHFGRAFQISGGSILTTKEHGVYGAFLPKRFAVQAQEMARASYADPDHTAFLRLLSAPTPDGPTVFVSLANAASYGPGAYADYVPAIDLGRLFGLSTLGILYLARFAGVAAYAGLLALAVRRLPYHRWVLVAAGLVPTAINQASTVSADGLTLGLSFLVVAEALYLGTAPPKVRQSLVEVGIAVCLLALAKPPYIVLAGLLLIPAWRQRGRLAASLGGILGVGAVLATAWGSYQGGHSLPQDTPKLFLDQSSVRYEFHHIDIHHQTQLIVTQPWFFLGALARTLGHAGVGTFTNLFGLMATYQEPWWIVLLAIVTLLSSIAVNESGTLLHLDRASRVWLLVATSVVFLAIYAIAYTNWNAYHSPVINVVPDRYFLPLLPWFLIGIIPSELRIRAVERVVDPRLLLSILLLIVSSVAVLAMWHFHYTGPAIFPPR